jgi:excisionase family DNA binding protein
MKIRQNSAFFFHTTVTDNFTTREVAQMLGLAVRSVQLMVDRGELDAWKTPGGHRRISRTSVDRWCATRGVGTAPRTQPAAVPAPPEAGRSGAGCVLLIEDSRHFQNLVGLLLKQFFPGVELHTADDGFAGLAMAGALQPDVLLVDLLLPGIDGATLITGLRSHPQFASMRLIVVTSLDAEQRAPYAFALTGVPVVHKPQLVAELPALLRQSLQSLGRGPQG